MKQNIFITALLLMFTISKMDAQRGVCDNGDFETTGFSGLYSFKSDSNIAFTCNTPIAGSGLTTIYPSFTTFDNFSDPFTLVTSGNEPSLSTLGVNVQRVYAGNYSMKLNSSGAPTKEIATMSRSVFPTNNVISFHYLMLAQNPGVDPEDKPKFIARLSYSGTVIAQLCIEVDNTTSGFESTGTTTNDFLYKDWSCHNFIIDESYINEELILEFIVIDDFKGAGVTTVYLDNICDVLCCVDCINGLGDVNNSIDNQEAATCIMADNSISNESEAIYHAGYEVVLLPDFEALAGTKDRFYIEGCSGEFAARGINVDESGKVDLINELDVYPNPVNTILNIDINGNTISSLEIYSLDGKKVFEKKENIEENITVDTSGLTKGVYVLRTETTTGSVKTYKLIKE